MSQKRRSVFMLANPLAGLGTLPAAAQYAPAPETHSVLQEEVQ